MIYTYITMPYVVGMLHGARMRRMCYVSYTHATRMQRSIECSQQTVLAQCSFNVSRMLLERSCHGHES